MDSHDVRREWAERSGEFSPTYYAHHGPNDTSEEIRRILDRFVDRTAPILELGCSSGRHLSHLFEHGFDDLSGIEINEEALAVMEAAYPDLAVEGEFHLDAIEAVVDEFDDDQFGAIYSVETLQHLHPDAEWVFDELSRITDDVLVTAEVERDANRTPPTTQAVSYVTDDVPLYYRDWKDIFTERGFVEVDAGTTRRDTVRTFRTAPARTPRRG